MAVTQTDLEHSFSDTDTSGSYPTGSITPSANKLVLAAIVTAQTGAGTSPTLSGNGLTWVEMTSGIGGNDTRLTLFRAMGASPSAGAVTIDVVDFTTACLWSISEFGGVDTSGTNGSGAVGTPVSNSAVATSLTVTLGAFGDAGNGTYGAFGRNVGTAVTHGTGFTEIADLASTAPARRIQTQWRVDNDTSVDASNTSSQWLGIAVELIAASTPTNQPGVHFGLRIK